MNYLKEINSFNDWLDTNKLSPSAIALWYALMNINNKAMWVKEFTVAVSLLGVKTGLSNRAVYKARDELKLKGRIDWKARQGRQSAVYTIIPLYENSAGNSTFNGTGSSAVKRGDNSTHNHAGNSTDNGASNLAQEDDTDISTDNHADKQAYQEAGKLPAKIHEHYAVNSAYNSADKQADNQAGNDTVNSARDDIAANLACNQAGNCADNLAPLYKLNKNEKEKINHRLSNIESSNSQTEKITVPPPTLPIPRAPDISNLPFRTQLNIITQAFEQRYPKNFKRYGSKKARELFHDTLLRKDVLPQVLFEEIWYDDLYNGEPNPWELLAPLENAGFFDQTRSQMTKSFSNAILTEQIDVCTPRN